MPLELYDRDATYSILNEEEVARVRELRRRYPGRKSAILPALWILQGRQGILTAEGMREVARALDVPSAAVEAVASFYSMYFFKPHGRYAVEVCTNLSCHLRGSTEILRRFEDRVGCLAGATSEDGAITLLEVECMGACGGAPAVQVNHRFFEGMTAAKVDQLVDDLRADRVDLHRLPTGAEVAERETLVDLANPGANRVPLPARGSAGPVVDLVKSGEVLEGREHPAERGYVQAPSPPTQPPPAPRGEEARA